MQIRALAVIALFFSLASAPFVQAQARRPLAIDDIYRTQQVGNPQCSPDGKWIAYTVTVIDREADKRRTSLWMVNWEGTHTVQLTSGMDGDSSPRWSPDGKYLSFLSTRPAGARKQVWLLDRLGGEARELTNVKDDIGGYAWSPDSSKIVLEMSAAEDDASVGKPSGAADSAKAPKPIVISRFHFKEDVEGYLTAASRSQLYLFDVNAKKLDPLTTDKKFDDGHPVWSPDSKRIAFVSNHEKDPDQSGADDIFVIDARPGSSPNKLISVNSSGGQHLSWSPDGKLIAYLVGSEPKYDAYKMSVLAVVPTAGGSPRVLTEKFDRGISAPEFTHDGSAITFLVADDRREYPAKISVSGGASGLPGSGGNVERLTDSGLVVSQHSSAGGHTAVLASSDSSAPEIYALSDGQLRKLSSHNDAFLSEIQLGVVEDISFKSKDGTEIHGMLIKPPNYDSGEKISNSALDSRRPQRPGRSRSSFQHLSART